MRNSNIFITILGITALLFTSCKEEKASRIPFEVKTSMFDQNQKNDLGMKTPKGLETFTIFKPTDSTDQFSNGAVMIAFKDQLYCQWQSSAKDEDSEDTWVAYSSSTDGKHWSSPMILSSSLEGGISTSGGWWVSGDSLVAYINTWPSKVLPEGGFAYYKTSTDGIHWSEKKPVLMSDGSAMQGVFEQDPHTLPNGRIISAAHFQPGLVVAPIYTDDPKGLSGWKRANFSNMSIKKDVSREIEPSWFLKENGNAVMVFRDQKSSHHSLASVSDDDGENWSTPVITDMPDSRSKQSAGNLPNGVAFLVNNPVQDKKRTPLAITLSLNGSRFDEAFVLRKTDDIQPLQYEGKYKRPGYHYPKSFVWKQHLYVSYTTNKEDVQYTKIPLSSLNIE